MAACARSERLEVTIPAGIDDGQRIALEGQGEAGPRGGPNGDLYVAVEVRDHPELVRRGTELFHELPITFPQAALGTTLTVPTVEGTRGGRRPGRRPVRPRDPLCAARACRGCAAAGRGDLHVIVNVVVPSKLSKRERELLRELDEVSDPAVLPKGGPSVFDWLRDGCSADRRTDALAGAQRRGRRRGRRGGQRDPRPRVPRARRVQPTRLIRDPADELSAREDPTAPYVMTAHVADGPDSAGQVDATERALWHLQAFGLRPVGALRVRPVDDADWTDAWKRHYVAAAHRPHRDRAVLGGDERRAGRRGRASWIRGWPSAPACTRRRARCLELLQEVSPMPPRVLDVGSGSGILALAALRLGAEAVVGYRHRSAGGRSRPCQRRAKRARRPAGGSRRHPAGRRRGSATRSCSPTSWPRSWSSSPRGSSPTSSRAACSSPAGSSTDRADEVIAALEGAGLIVRQRRDDGEWVALRLEAPR